jgi:DNA adenine methylase
MSLNDHPQVRYIFKAFEIRPVQLKYSANNGRNTVRQELLISNYTAAEVK